VNGPARPEYRIVEGRVEYAGGENPFPWGLTAEQAMALAGPAGGVRRDAGRTAGRRVCVSVVMDAYPYQRFPAELTRPCPLKTRVCLLYDEDVTLDPKPADGRHGPVLRDCRGCEARGEGFAPRGGPASP
jgi:hypothetical protein